MYMACVCVVCSYLLRLRKVGIGLKNFVATQAWTRMWRTTCKYCGETKAYWRHGTCAQSWPFLTRVSTSLTALIAYHRRTTYPQMRTYYLFASARRESLRSTLLSKARAFISSTLVGNAMNVKSGFTALKMYDIYKARARVMRVSAAMNR